MENKNDVIYGQFRNLAPISTDDSFSVITVFDYLTHKLGISKEGYPMFFISCCDNKVTTDISLKMFKVSFNRQCKLTEGNTSTTQKYSIIQLNSINPELQKYFIQVVLLVLKKIPSIPSVEQLKRELDNVIRMFTASVQISPETVRGLWAELLIIESGSNPEYLLKSWHAMANDKYDFNDGINKLEVKSTGNEERNHSFALEQLNPNTQSNLIIASVVVLNSGIGRSILDLVDSISLKLTSINDELKLKEMVLKTIGMHIDEIQEMKFDYAYGVDSIKYYDYRNIPSINIHDVPAEVSSVHFSSCLKNVLETYIKSISKGNRLYESL